MKRNDNPYDKMLNTAGRAAKAAASGLLLALLLAGCSQKNPVKTQPISSMESSSEALGETSQTAAASEISPSASGTAGSIETDAESYYRAKAEQDAIHIDIAKLEADFRVGKLSKEDFAAQKSQLEAEKDALDSRGGSPGRQPGSGLQPEQPRSPVRKSGRAALYGV